MKLTINIKKELNSYKMYYEKIVISIIEDKEVLASIDITDYEIEDIPDYDINNPIKLLDSIVFLINTHFDRYIEDESTETLENDIKFLNLYNENREMLNSNLQKDFEKYIIESIATLTKKLSTPIHLSSKEAYLTIFKDALVESLEADVEQLKKSAEYLEREVISRKERLQEDINKKQKEIVSKEEYLKKLTS